MDMPLWDMVHPMTGRKYDDVVESGRMAFRNWKEAGGAMKVKVGKRLKNRLGLLCWLLKVVAIIYHYLLRLPCKAVCFVAMRAFLFSSSSPPSPSSSSSRPSLLSVEEEKAFVVAVYGGDDDTPLPLPLPPPSLSPQTPTAASI